MKAATVVFALVGVLLCAVPCNAGLYGMDPNCPEGCRAIDMEVSCGSIANVLNCNMNVAGNVTMGCTDGRIRFLGSMGCVQSRNTSIPYILPTQPPTFGARAILNFESHISQVYSGMKGLFPYLPVVVSLAVGLYFCLLSYRLERLSLLLLGAIAGEALALAVMSCFHMSIDNVWKAAPLGIVPIAVGVLCGTFKFVAAFFTGLASGWLVAVIALAEVYVRMDRRLDSIAFYIICGSIAVGSVLGRTFPVLSLIICSALVSSFLITNAAMELIPKSVLGSHCSNITEWNQCSPTYAVEGFAVLLILVSFGAQVLWRRQMRRAEAREILGIDSDSSLALLNEQHHGGRRPRRGIYYT